MTNKEKRDIIRKAREAANISTEDAAEILHLGRACYAAWEHGGIVFDWIKSDKLEEICILYKIELSMLT